MIPNQDEPLSLKAYPSLGPLKIDTLHTTCLGTLGLGAGSVAQRVHVVLQYIHGPQRGYQIMTPGSM